MTGPTPEPLAGLRVVDALGGLLGGYCSKMLTDAGAATILLEPRAGDSLRRWRAGSDDPTSDDGALFRFLRAGQRSVRLGSDDDIARWAGTADCVILGLGGPSPEELLAEDPGLVVVSITPYGRTGEWADRPATDFTLQADAGGLTIRGRPDRPPYHAAGRTGEWFSAAMAATAAAACLRRARDSGVGGHVDLSQAECVNLAMTNYAALMAELRGPSGYERAPAITETPAVEPTADGYMVFTTNTQQQFSDFCVLLGRPELLETYASAASRQADWNVWNDIVHEFTRPRTTAEIIRDASALRIPVAPVCNGESVTRVEHFVERGVYRAGRGCDLHRTPAALDVERAAHSGPGTGARPTPPPTPPTADLPTAHHRRRPRPFHFTASGSSTTRHGGPVRWPRVCSPRSAQR